MPKKRRRDVMEIVNKTYVSKFFPDSKVRIVHAVTGSPGNNHYIDERGVAHNPFFFHIFWEEEKIPPIQSSTDEVSEEPSA